MMRSYLGQAQEQPAARPAPNGPAPAAVAASGREIPYDYVATFTLKGEPGHREQDVINVSVDGAFVAVAIGYSFLPGNTTELVRVVQPTVGQIESTAAASPPTSEFLRNLAILATAAATVATSIGIDAASVARCLAIRLCGIDFKYSIVDSATGRELQNKAIHNIAGLGKADGDRPFRPFAKPMLFMPRSTIRIEIEEVSAGRLFAGGTLFFVLHGYKLLGYGVGPP